MSELDQAIEKHMANLVHLENRPFSYRDFMLFEVEGKEFRMAHGTYRNKISRLKNAGKVQLAYNAGMAFHTLKGKMFGKQMTPNHTTVHHSNNDSFCRLIYNLPTDKAALHDIRLKFKVHGISNTISSGHPEFPVNQRSKDICIPTWKIDDLLVRTFVHKSDTISVTVGCSLDPVAVDIKGIIRLSNALTRVEERLAILLTNIGNGENLEIPDHNRWVVTMWHFGVDSFVEYTGDKFAITWETGQHILIRLYTKIMKDKKTRIRLERQEYPNRTFPELMEERLNLVGRRLSFDPAV
jgi:hypothetical protein